jgi:hypothetical protein
VDAIAVSRSGAIRRGIKTRMILERMLTDGSRGYRS